MLLTIPKYTHDEKLKERGDKLHTELLVTYSLLLLFNNSNPSSQIPIVIGENEEFERLWVVLVHTALHTEKSFDFRYIQNSQRNNLSPRLIKLFNVPDTHQLIDKYLYYKDGWFNTRTYICFKDSRHYPKQWYSDVFLKRVKNKMFNCTDAEQCSKKLTKLQKSIEVLNCVIQEDTELREREENQKKQKEIEQEIDEIKEYGIHPWLDDLRCLLLDLPWFSKQEKVIVAMAAAAILLRRKSDDLESKKLKICITDTNTIIWDTMYVYYYIAVLFYVTKVRKNDFKFGDVTVFSGDKDITEFVHRKAFINLECSPLTAFEKLDKLDFLPARQLQQTDNGYCDYLKKHGLYPKYHRFISLLISHVPYGQINIPTSYIISESKMFLLWSKIVKKDAELISQNDQYDKIIKKNRILQKYIERYNKIVKRLASLKLELKARRFSQDVIDYYIRELLSRLDPSSIVDKIDKDAQIDAYNFEQRIEYTSYLQKLVPDSAKKYFSDQFSNYTINTCTPAGYSILVTLFNQKRYDITLYLLKIKKISSMNMDYFLEYMDKITYRKIKHKQEESDMKKLRSFAKNQLDESKYLLKYGERDEHGIPKEFSEEEILEKISKGADINAQSYNGDTILKNAVRCQNELVVKCLLDNDADPLIVDEYGKIVRDFVMSDSPIYQSLIEREEELILNGISKQDRIVHKFLEKCANCNATIADIEKILAVSDGKSEDSNIMDSANDEGYTGLMLAIDANNERIAEYLLSQGANPFLKSKSGLTARQLASRSSSIYQVLKGYELLRYTLEGKLAQVNSLLITDPTLIDFQGINGYTALLVSVQQNDTKLTKFLLELGANTAILCDDGRGVAELIESDSMKETINTFLAGNDIMEEADDSSVMVSQDNSLDNLFSLN